MCRETGRGREGGWEVDRWAGSCEGREAGRESGTKGGRQGQGRIRRGKGGGRRAGPASALGAGGFREQPLGSRSISDGFKGLLAMQ